MTQIKSPTLERFISKRVHSIQFRNLLSTLEWETTINEYLKRTENTCKKIDNLLRRFRMGPTYNPNVEVILGILYNVIGVYFIPDIRDERPYLWSKITNFTDEINPVLGNYWPSYFGSSTIADGSGRIVVVLSDEGVKWLNEIADKVKSYIPVETE